MVIKVCRKRKLRKKNVCYVDIEFRVPYHNDFHGADVLQTTHCLLTKSNLMNVFTQIEIAALVS
jgi:hypothetical protein